MNFGRIWKEYFLFFMMAYPGARLQEFTKMTEKLDKISGLKLGLEPSSFSIPVGSISGIRSLRKIFIINFLLNKSVF
jgi:hypothetical protein